DALGTMAASSACLAAERKPWWLSNRKVGVAAPPWCISWYLAFQWSWCSVSFSPFRYFGHRCSVSVSELSDLLVFSSLLIAITASKPDLCRLLCANPQVVDKNLREARALITTQEQSNVSTAVGLLDAALARSPRLEAALELKARSLLFLLRFREVADMLKDYIPSYKGDGGGGDDGSTSSLGAGDHSLMTASSAPLTRERANLLSPGRERSDGDRCFSVSDLKRRLLAGLSRSSYREGEWRYVHRGHHIPPHSYVLHT
ncbi:hypothetical protein GW17_00012615, partial [Ensete ventricosum]